MDFVTFARVCKSRYYYGGLMVLLKKPLFAVIVWGFFSAQSLALQRISVCGDNEIVREQKVFVRLSVKENRWVPCTRNDEMKYLAKIKLRGSSSSRFAKKGYQIDFYDENQKRIALSLLGLPKSKKWIFNGPYGDRSLIRNVLGYELAREVGKSSGQKWFAPRTKFFELKINNKFLGLYVLTEKIEFSPQKVSSTLYDKKSTTGPFMLEIATNDGDFKTINQSELTFRQPSRKQLAKLLRKDPELTKAIKGRIIGQIERFEAMLNSNQVEDKNMGYKSWIDDKSFVDFIIIQEVFKNTDGYRRSGYFYRGDDGLLHMGPIWDLNAAMGNHPLFGMDSPKHWRVHSFSIIRPVSWFKSLLKIKSFKSLLIKRYKELRQPNKPLATDNIIGKVDNFVSLIGQAANRDRILWGEKVGFWAKAVVRTRTLGESYREDINILKDWFKKRLIWMDKNIERI